MPIRIQIIMTDITNTLKDGEAISLHGTYPIYGKIYSGHTQGIYKSKIGSPPNLTITIVYKDGAGKPWITDVSNATQVERIPAESAAVWGIDPSFWVGHPQRW